MARYDLPTYVLHVLGHFWMFAVNNITEWIFSLKSSGLWTHLPIVWDKVPNKSVFLTPSQRQKYEMTKRQEVRVMRLDKDDIISTEGAIDYL